MLSTSLIAHILAGGNSLSVISAGYLALFSILIASILTTRSGDPIKAALAIFLAQNSGHFLLGGHITDQNQMLFAHIVAGFAGYHLLRYFDRSLPSLGELFLNCLTPHLPRHQVFTDVRQRVSIFSFRSLADFFFALNHSLRAPPTH